jgi:hypothetical protein
MTDEGRAPGEGWEAGYVVPGPEHAPRVAALRRQTLPNGMEVAYQSKAEVG